MYKVFLVMLSSLVAHSLAADSRIVGGYEVEERRFPYIASLRYKGRHFCGGSIIDNKWILTAAHCLYGSDSKIPETTAVVDTIYLDSGGTEYNIEKYFVHHFYNKILSLNDIALINLKENIEFSETVQPIKLAEGNTEPGVDLVLCGWGRTSYPGKPSNKLKAITLTSISTQDCAVTHLRPEVLASTICTYTKVGEGACHGDSGGPLVHGNEQVGVVSWGRPCARGKPDVFTNVYMFTGWIKDIIDQ